MFLYFFGVFGKISVVFGFFRIYYRPNTWLYFATNWLCCGCTSHWIKARPGQKPGSDLILLILYSGIYRIKNITVFSSKRTLCTLSLEISDIEIVQWKFKNKKLKVVNNKLKWTAYIEKVILKVKQEAQLWQRDCTKLDTFSINVKRYSQNHAHNWIFLGRGA